MRRHREELLRYASELIRSRREDHSPGPDLLDRLLGVRPGGRGLSETEIQGQVAGLFIAGTETTAAALGCAMVHGAANPREWARLREEPGVAADYVAKTFRARGYGGPTRTLGVSRARYGIYRFGF